MKAVRVRHLPRSYDVTASIIVYADGTARLKIKHTSGKVLHDKIHTSEKAALSSWYRWNS